MIARQALRSATAENHDRVDALFSAFDLGSPHGYRAFLSAQAEPFVATERELECAGVGVFVPDWRERRRSHLLLDDLSKLAASDLRVEDDASLREGGTDSRIRRADAPALLGALYVLEGSRLGGALLKQRVPDHLPTRFLAAPEPAGSWRKLLEILDSFLYDPARIDAAVGAARAVFKRFEHGGKRVLESMEAR